MTEELRIALKVREEDGIDRRRWPLTRGVPLPQEAGVAADDLRLEDAEGRSVPLQVRVLNRWSDGSPRWVLVDFQAEVGARGEAIYWLCSGGGESEVEVEEPLEVVETDGYVEVCSGPLHFAVKRERFGLLEGVELGRRDENGKFIAARQVTTTEGGEAWARICESRSDGELGRRIYGMGGNCLASLGREEYAVEVEETGPLRTVICCRGAYEADVPMHHYAGYRPLRFITRIHAYAGQTFVRVLHTVVFIGNPRETEVEEIGLRIPLQLSGKPGYQIAGRRAMEGELADGDYWLLSQHSDNHFHLERQGSGRVRRLAEGERTEGWVAMEDGEMGVGVALRYMAEEYPKALGVDARGIDLFLWRDPEGKRLSFGRYAEEVAWHEGEGVYADGTGAAKSSEFFVDFHRASEAAEVEERLRGLLAWPGVAVDSEWMERCSVAGGFAVRDAERFPETERMLSGFLEWMERQIGLARWYGFLDWGDVLCTWEEEKDDWRFRGRWGWCNSEWDPRHGVWIQYLRTGEERYFRLGEAMTRHSVDVDTCHFHPFRPHMVGGCFRHSVDHFGDEPCASHTFLENWVDYYYLTGDQRTLEVIREAGEFFLRYRWSEDPTFSFSLRSIANTLRGLLHVCEVTGDERFMRRAEEVYAVIARGQNEDGSWHKRFQVSTPDRLPDQAPYGMATEGTTLAVEMGTAPSLTDAELRTLGPPFDQLQRVMPVSEQKGYQTHYLMIGLEKMLRMTEREEVRERYLKAVDWFCGNAWSAEFALGQHYYGILCRHLGYAHRLTGERRYLEIGQKLLQQLIESQDWSDDPRKRGAVAMTPTAVSLLFFGVPFLLEELENVGMGEK
jgi:hypothetical protein